MVAARLAEREDRGDTTPPALEGISISSTGAKNSAIPFHESVIKQAPAPAASNIRVGGEKPTSAMDSRFMLSTMRAELFRRLWSPVETWPIQRTLDGSFFPSHPSPPRMKLQLGHSSAARRKNSSTRFSRSGSLLPTNSRSHAN